MENFIIIPSNVLAFGGNEFSFHVEFLVTFLPILEINTTDILTLPLVS